MFLRTADNELALIDATGKSKIGKKGQRLNKWIEKHPQRVTKNVKISGIILMMKLVKVFFLGDHVTRTSGRDAMKLLGLSFKHGFALRK